MRRSLLGIALLAVLLLAWGCGEKGEQATGQDSPVTETETAPAPDELAYRNARALTDPDTSKAAWWAFLDQYPQSEHRPMALYSMWQILADENDEAALSWAREALAKETDDVCRGTLYERLFSHAVDMKDERGGMALAREFAAAELADPDALNGIAWNLIEETGWDVALGTELATRAVDLAEPGIPKAGILDTAAWGNHKLGNHERAAALLIEAFDHLPQPWAELVEHLETIYEASGDEKGLLDLYTRQLSFSLSPDMMDKALALAAKHGEKAQDYEARLWTAREERSRPAPDFTLTALDGSEHNLRDLKGKVVLLNFWHPT